jgi:PAS domain S-box-containing protein
VFSFKVSGAASPSDCPTVSRNSLRARVLAAGIQAPLVDLGILQMPYMVSFAFMAIVVAMGYELGLEVVEAGRLSREVKADERRWRSLLENVELAVVGVDTVGRVNYVNPFLSRLLGCERESLLGRPIEDLLPEREREHLRNRLSEAIASGPRPHSQWPLLCSNGKERMIAWSTVRLFDSGEVPTGILAVGADISFESLVWARSLLTGRPGPPELAPVFTEGDNRVEVPLAPQLSGQCEFVLASGEALPFAGDGFRVAASCNLIDVMEKPSLLIDEKKRLLGPGGLLLLSSPFLHTAVGVRRCLAPEGRMPADVLRAMLDERGFSVTAEREDVPWVLYHYRRRLDFYHTFCLAARRRAAPGK